MTKRYPFESDGRYLYDFTPQGLFTLVNSEGESLYDGVIPLCEKLGSHLVWIFLWIAGILISHLFFDSLIFDRLLMSAIIIHLFFFGCRLTTLLLEGGFLPVFFPPLWIRLTRQMQKGKGIEVLKKHHLEEHPGLLFNLALIQLSRQHEKEACQNFRQAYALCPDHPLLHQLIEKLDLKET